MDTKLQAKEMSGEKCRGFSFTYKDFVRYALSLSVGAAVGTVSLPFGAVPFGFAALCASGVGAPFVYAGLCLSFFRGGSIALFAAYTLCFLLRVGVSACMVKGSMTLAAVGKKIFREPLVAKVLVAAACAFSLGAYKLFRGGFLYYDLFGTLICLSVTVVCTLLWSTVEAGNGIWQTVGILSLCGVCVWALGGVRFYGIGLAAFVCMFFSLVFTNRRSVVFGAFLALTSGLCVSFSYAPLFVFGAVCYSFLGLLSPFFGVACSFAASMAWGIYIGGMSAFYDLLGALLAANLLFFAIERLYFKPKSEIAEETPTAAPDTNALDCLRKLCRQLPSEYGYSIKDICEYVENVVGANKADADRPPVLCAHISGKKKSAPSCGDVCGDDFEYFQGGDDTAIAFISDGMGSGSDAAHAAGVCTSLLKVLLPPAVRSKQGIRCAARLVNGALCRDNRESLRECTSTLDVGIFDLIEGNADFYKCGAAPTYLLRDGTLSTLRAHTLPIGVMQSTDIGVVNTAILPCDVVIMLSDGVLDGKEECPEFFDYLKSRVLTHTPAQLADAIIDYAVTHGATDDISAVVIKFEEVSFM